MLELNSLAGLLVRHEVHVSSLMALQQVKHFLASTCFNWGLGKASSIFITLQALQAYLTAVSSLRCQGPCSPCLQRMQRAGKLARTLSHCSCSKRSKVRTCSQPEQVA